MLFSLEKLTRLRRGWVVHLDDLNDYSQQFVSQEETNDEEGQKELQHFERTHFGSLKWL